MNTALRVAALAAVLLAAGCGGGGPNPVEGTVTYDGQPIGVGSITFLPADEKAVKGGGMIVNGKYKVDGDGLTAGTHRVEIRWNKPTGKKYKNEFGEEYDRTAEGLPAKYHDNSTLTAEVKSGPNVIDFKLEK